ncbi:MAG: hypothetical protein P8Q39_01385 [Candidatus Thalassarchaeaceae archaeon]|nr:hypothetical protein [Candidatus Thalassarchaeaceae archaeon]
MKLIPLIIGSVILVVTIFAGFIGFSGEGTESIDVPSCSTGISGLDFCDKSAILEQNIPIPNAVNGIIVANFVIQWDSPDAWIGIVDAGDADQCVNSGEGYLLCDTEDLAFFEGGPDSSGEIDWTLSGGDYRFVAGNSIDGTSETTEITYKYDIILTSNIAWFLAMIGIGLVARGLVKS